MNVIELHRSVWGQLQTRRAQLPHALLLSGQAGIGKFDLAWAFAASILCESPSADGLACAHCLACNWFPQGNHPDFRLLQPDALAEADGDGEDGKKKASQQITIDQVRALDAFFTVGTHRSGLRIILVNPAEAMNRNTANALLKTLEEPAPGTLFLLVSNEPLRLLPTIRSRSQTVPVPVPGNGAATAVLAAAGIPDAEVWLALAGGAPRLALELAQAGQGAWLDLLVKALEAGRGVDVLGVAGEIDRTLKAAKGKLTLRQVVEWIQKWVVDLNLAGSGLPIRYFLRQQATIGALAGSAAQTGLIAFHRGLLRRRREVEQPLNARLFLEALLLEYRTLFAD